MKKTIFLTLFTFIAVCIHGQKIDQKNVPAVVLNAFQLKYANADDIDWKLEKGVFHVEFELNNKDHDVWLDEKGTILKHEQELWQSEIPAGIIETVRSKCKYFDLDDAERKDEGGKIIYYISFEVDNKDCDFWIEGTGRLLKYKRELKDSEIPAAIMTSIQSQYASFDIEDALLTEESGKITYRLKTEINDKDHHFWFDGKGKLLKHNQDLRKSEIPVSVLNSISSLYAGYEIRDADKITEGGKIIFDLELKKSRDKIQVFFTPNGKVVKTNPG